MRNFCFDLQMEIYVLMYKYYSLYWIKIVGIVNKVNIFLNDQRAVLIDKGYLILDDFNFTRKSIDLKIIPTVFQTTFKELDYYKKRVF
ncbi:hypothetical protein E2986_13613 [Frieseomelitta varia]|uniref:Uncharacterized protein n=1 Tax=Frieseomelitta varia TaxID=561572 RepID=A0A833S121_9HYME|nr:hypothetical protein E2986_13613 [Frieseomelitta varia]